jgi:hypothetical protein
VILKLIEEKEVKALLIFLGNYADAGVWGILPFGGIQWPKSFLVCHCAELLIL